MKYLERYRKVSCDRSFELSIDTVHPIVVVIPAYKENFEVIKKTLLSLELAAEYFNKKTTILLLVNWNIKDGDNIKVESQNLYSELKNLSYNYLEFLVFQKELSGKKSGVGMARKILMDTAFHNMLKFDIDGLIINLDADTIVAENYFTEIEKHFVEKPNMEAASIAFSHIDDSNNEASITVYELHLRYFINMQRLLNLPYAFQTVGSAMVVRRDAYAKEGGMVKRQAGEDFYFLHKYTKNETLFEINTTCVYPSSRGSNRVPFGTGKAVNDIKEVGVLEYTTYNPKSFLVLDQWINCINEKASQCLDFNSIWIGSDDDFLNQFLISVNAKFNIEQITKNVTHFEAFKKRFFNWFDAFLLMKYLHYVRDLGYSDVKIDEAIIFLFDKLNLSVGFNRNQSLKTLLKFDLENVYEFNS